MTFNYYDEDDHRLAGTGEYLDSEFPPDEHDPFERSSEVLDWLMTEEEWEERLSSGTRDKYRQELSEEEPF